MSNASTISRLIQPGGSIISSGGEAVVGGGTETYATVNDLPLSGNDAGDQAFVEENDALYLWTGTEWKRVYTGTDEIPIFDNAIENSYVISGTVNPNGYTIDASATDPEGFPITYDYIVNPSNQTYASVTNNQDGTFTITPAGDINNPGIFSIKLKATDGVHVSSKTSSITIEYDPILIVGPYQAHSGEAFGTNANHGGVASNVFNPDVQAAWHTGSGGGTWGYDFGEGAVVELTSYKIMQRNSGVYHYMSSWTVDGSNDGVNWTTMYAQNYGSGWPQPPAGQVADLLDYWVDFTVPEANRSTYRYIRFAYTGGSGYQVFAAVELYGHVYA